MSAYIVHRRILWIQDLLSSACLLGQFKPHTLAACGASQLSSMFHPVKIQYYRAYDGFPFVIACVLVCQRV